MSMTGGQIFGAVIGAAIMVVFPPAGLVAAGSVYGGFAAASLGASIGLFVGGIIDPPDAEVVKQEGSRLGDLSSQTAEWGTPIRRLFGTYRLTGNVIWSLSLLETKHVEESGEGKGGGGTMTETTWYSYAGSWAVGFCEGPVIGIKRIWFDSVLVYDGVSYSGGLNVDNHTSYFGTSTQVIDWYMQQSDIDTPAYRHLAYIVFREIELENYGNKIPRVSVEFTQSSSITVSDIAESLFLRAGLEQNDFDTSEGIDFVEGYVVTNPMSTRVAIEPITSAFSYDLIEVNGNIKINKRGASSLVTIEEDELINFLQIERRQNVELSKSINILYANKDKNYDTGSQSVLRIDLDSLNNKTYQYPIALSDDQAKQIAEMYLYSEWNERLIFELSLPPEYINLEPSDVITVKHENNIFNIRITDLNLTSNNQVNIKAVNEDSSKYDSNSVGSDTNNSYIDTEVRIDEPTNLVLLDIPMLDNYYNEEGIYLAVNGVSNTWRGCSIDKSIDNEVTYNTYETIIDESIFGESTTILLDGPTTEIDFVNSVTVSSSSTLYGESIEVLYTNAVNYILIGSEILQYSDVVDNLDGTYTLSNFLRGRRGTEWATSTHSISEVFVFLSNSMSFDKTASRFVTTQYRATSFGLFTDDSIPEVITPEIVCLKPLSPSYLFAIKEANDDITITWTRRSRDVTGYMKTLQIFEEAELYSLDIDGRLETSSTTEFIYTDAMQIADGYVKGSFLNIDVYQVSGIVGNGYMSSYVYGTF